MNETRRGATPRPCNAAAWHDHDDDDGDDGFLRTLGPRPRPTPYAVMENNNDKYYDPIDIFEALEQAANEIQAQRAALAEDEESLEVPLPMQLDGVGQDFEEEQELVNLSGNANGPQLPPGPPAAAANPPVPPVPAAVDAAETHLGATVAPAAVGAGVTRQRQRQRPQKRAGGARATRDGAPAQPRATPPPLPALPAVSAPPTGEATDAGQSEPHRRRGRRASQPNRRHPPAPPPPNQLEAHPPSEPNNPSSPPPPPRDDGGTGAAGAKPARAVAPLDLKSFGRLILQTVQQVQYARERIRNLPAAASNAQAASAVRGAASNAPAASAVRVAAMAIGDRTRPAARDLRQYFSDILRVLNQTVPGWCANQPQPPDEKLCPRPLAGVISNHRAPHRLSQTPGELNRQKWYQYLDTALVLAAYATWRDLLGPSFLPLNPHLSDCLATLVDVLIPVLANNRKRITTTNRMVGGMTTRGMPEAEAEEWVRETLQKVEDANNRHLYDPPMPINLQA